MVPNNEFIADVCDDMSEILDPFQRERLKNVLVLRLQDCTIERLETAVVPYEGMGNDQMIKKFIIAKKIVGLSEKTLKYYAMELELILGSIGKNVGDIVSDDILVYFAKRDIEDKVSKVTQGNELRVLRTFFSWCTGEELIIRDPTKKIASIKQGKRKKKAFSEIEIERIRDGCETNRERAIVELLLSTWCRASELVAIKSGDIDGKRVNIIGKGNKERYVYLNAKSFVVLEKYLSERKDRSDYIFPSKIAGTGKTTGEWYMNPEFVNSAEHMESRTLQDVLHRIAKRAGLDPSEVHPHKFRRTGATLALKHGMPIAQVSALLGHSSIATTQIYLDITDDDLELAHKRFVN